MFFIHRYLFELSDKDLLAFLAKTLYQTRMQFFLGFIFQSVTRIIIAIHPCTMRIAESISVSFSLRNSCSWKYGDGVGVDA